MLSMLLESLTTAVEGRSALPAQTPRNGRRKAGTLAKKAAIKAEQERATLAALTATASATLTSFEVGQATGTTRCTAYKRLVDLESAGKVVRLGHGVTTKWSLA